jgi:DNA-binding NtrC family response regulator
MSSKKILMIVDDTPNIGRALSRMIGRHFDEVHVLTGAAEASDLLGRTRVTHVICDQCLGEGDPRGLDLVPRWRRAHPSIERAIVLTGFDARTLVAGPEIDAVVSKLTGSHELMGLLDPS